MTTSPPSKLAELFPIERILLNADCQSKKRIFEQVSILLENINGLTRDDVFSKLIARERLGSTAVGNKGAIPHARIDNLQKPICIFVKLANPIQYDAQDNSNSLVQMLFFFIVPEKATTKHLCLLAVFSSMLQDEPLMESLANCADVNLAREQIIDWETAHQDTIDEIFADKD